MSRYDNSRRKAKNKKVYRLKQLSFIVFQLAAAVRTTFGFVALPFRAHVHEHVHVHVHAPALSMLPQRVTMSTPGRKRKIISRRQRSLSLEYAGNGDGDGDNNSEGVDMDMELDLDNTALTSSARTRIPFVVHPNDDIRYNKQNEQDDNDYENTMSMSMSMSNVSTTPRSTDILATLKEVLTAPVLPAEDKDDKQQKQQRLIIPIHTTASKTNNLSDPAATAIGADSINSLQNDTATKKKKNKLSKMNNIDLGLRWRRLRPGQKFRFRLGAAAIAFVSIWNTVVVRNYSGFITDIVTGAAAATTTNTAGFGGILRRWFSNRGFQGIAALGRSIAYGWAILVAYPRMLDRRAKERRLKREEEAFTRWRHYLKGTADEVVRLRRELSLLDGEIRTFRREILTIRAARINNSSTATATKISGSTDSDDNNLPRGDNNNIYNGSDRILRDAVINEMSHLTRLRDDTRFALTTARQRWSEVRAKPPISNSKSASTSTSAFDALEFELGSTADFEYDGNDRDYGNDDLLLSGF